MPRSSISQIRFVFLLGINIGSDGGDVNLSRPGGREHDVLTLLVRLRVQEVWKCVRGTGQRRILTRVCERSNIVLDRSNLL